VVGGSAYLPLDPANQPERLALMLADSKVAVVIADADIALVTTAPTAPLLTLIRAVAPPPSPSQRPPVKRKPVWRGQ